MNVRYRPNVKKIAPQNKNKLIVYDTKHNFDHQHELREKNKLQVESRIRELEARHRKKNNNYNLNGSNNSGDSRKLLINLESKKDKRDLLDSKLNLKLIAERESEISAKTKLSLWKSSKRNSKKPSLLRRNSQSWNDLSTSYGTTKTLLTTLNTYSSSTESLTSIQSLQRMPLVRLNTFQSKRPPSRGSATDSSQDKWKKLTRDVTFKNKSRPKIASISKQLVNKREATTSAETSNSDLLNTGKVSSKPKTINDVLQRRESVISTRMSNQLPVGLHVQTDNDSTISGRNKYKKSNHSGSHYLSNLSIFGIRLQRLEDNDQDGNHIENSNGSTKTATVNGHQYAMKFMPTIDDDIYKVNGSHKKIKIYDLSKKEKYQCKDAVRQEINRLTLALERAELREKLGQSNTS